MGDGETRRQGEEETVRNGDSPVIAGIKVIKCCYFHLYHLGIVNYNPMLLKKIPCIDGHGREMFLVSLLDPFNKHA